MEILCQVSASVPDADVPPPDPPRPIVTSMADVGAVQMYAERIADKIDAIAERQVVQDVPVDVIESMLGTNDAMQPPAGTYGDLVIQLRQALRNQGNAPRDIATALRDIATAVDVMRRDQAIFNNTKSIMFLQLLSAALKATIECASGGIDGAAAACGITAAFMAIEASIGTLQAINLGHEQQNKFDAFRLRIDGAFSLIEAKQAEMLNAADEVRRILGALRSARMGAQNAIAGALFASSDAAGRHYPANTAMRRVYDINLQRYRAAHQASVRMATIARMAVEQRFGVDLEAQKCATLVEPPSTWAADVCNTTGINYAEIRDPEADVGADAIRQMFIGDYVRRLEHYTESYRFDFPYTSGEDLMVISVRDDIIRPQVSCDEQAINLLALSNDLTARTRVTETGEPVTTGELAWHVSEDGCTEDPVTGAITNCVDVQAVDGPRFASSVGAPGPVPGRIASKPPRGFEVMFARGAPSSTDYSNSAALVQDVLLPPGTYRLSWYQRGMAEPQVDARTAVITPSNANPYEAVERAMTGDWVRKFMFFTAPSTAEATLYHIGVFPAPMTAPLHVQAIAVAGMQLEDVSASPTAEAFRLDAIIEADHGPPLFVATTAAGWANFDDCPSRDPVAFRRGWQYRCADLCSGGFDQCTDREVPRKYCYYETLFDLDEDRLVGRGDGFGGGFAFGNFNYRTGDVAVNVVGTGIRTCDAVSGDGCYTTAGIPFSLSHDPSGIPGVDDSAYTVRAHDGSIHPVHLFRGQIESGRALAAERYLTNPLSPADASLLADYQRAELRGRPMSGSYRLILWDLPGFEFHRVEDVQLLLRYRYFTRTGSRLMCGG